MMRKILFFAALMLTLFLTAAPAMAAEPQVDNFHLFINPNDASSIEVQEQVVFQEALPADTQLSFSLPAGIQNLQFLQGVPEGQAQVVDNVLQIKKVDPQAEYLAFSFTVPLQGPHAMIDQKIDYDANSFFVIYPKGTFTVSAEGLADGGTQAMGDTEYQLLSLANPTAGTELQMTVIQTDTQSSNTSGGALSQTPAASPDFHSPGHIRFWNQSPFSGMNPHLFLVLIIVIPILALIIYLTQRKREQDENKAAHGTNQEELFQKLYAQEKILKEKLKEIELQHQDGKIEESDYMVRREAYKKKLVEVRVKLHKLAD